MGVLAVGERRDGTSEPSMSSENCVCNGTGVTGKLPKPGDIILDPIFDVETAGDLENGSCHDRF